MSFIDFENKNILIVGYGNTGKGVDDFLKTKNCNVFLFDDNKKIYPNNIEKIDYAIVSPGIDIKNSAIYGEIAKSKAVVMSELDLCSQFCKKPIVAITGTNGKTTTTSLVNNILSQTHKSCAVGNIGVSFAQNCQKNFDYFVCECSSFQLENSNLFNPKIAAFLNFSCDHLSRHKTLKEYLRCKTKIFSHLTKNDFAVLNYDLKKLSKKIKYKKNIYYFSIHKKVKGTFVKDDNIYFFDGKKTEKIIGTNLIKLKGQKNLENVLASVLICKLLKISNNDIAAGIISFVPFRYRLEEIADDCCDVVVNDSKSTNISSTMCALEAYNNKEIILLLGGDSKGQDFKDFFCNFAHNVVCLICFGGDGELIFNTAKKFNLNCQLFLKSNLKNAAIFAKKIACKNHVILFSPACASFDEFENYKHRGECFEKYIKQKI